MVLHAYLNIFSSFHYHFAFLYHKPLHCLYRTSEVLISYVEQKIVLKLIAFYILK